MNALLLGMILSARLGVAAPDPTAPSAPVGGAAEPTVVTGTAQPSADAGGDGTAPGEALRRGAASPPPPPTFDSPNAGFEVGNTALAKGDLAAAEAAYRAVLAVAPDPDVYYNLGNVLWREKQSAAAILAWRTAAVDAPRDPDLAANLEFAHRTTKDALAVPSNVPAWAPWMSALSVGEASWMASALLGVALVLVGLRRKFPQLPAVGIAVGLGSLGVVVGAGVLARAGADPVAVVLVPEVAVTSDLGGGVTLFSLHAGAEVLAAEASGGSVLVVLADGRRGWVPASSVGIADPSAPFPVL